MTWLQLRSRAVRSVALLLGMLLATTAFTVLTAASRTEQLRTIGTVSAHFVPAYDILVRPKGTRTRLETQTGTYSRTFCPGSTAASLAVRVTALTMLAAVTFAFRGVIVGSLLGDAVAVQVRGVDYVAAIATIALCVLAVADVMFLNVRDARSPVRHDPRIHGGSPHSPGSWSPKAQSSA